MLLSDKEIEQRLEQLFPQDWKSLLDRIQPCSVDLTIEGPLLRVDTKDFGTAPIRPGSSDTFEVPISKDDRWILRPGILYLVSTRETIVVPPDLLSRLDGRSSWARVGLRVHATAGFLDPGFRGKITLELDVVGPPVDLRVGDSICQVSFQKLSSPALMPYGSRKSRYQDQAGVTASRASKE